ncbi:GNAT family N-acetyltransferase [Chitinophaga sp. CC14]|uniref:GNAT family N-acetyltransferase n=1 Tax=Chitinophaga sp. CC14 TaxID=3029199 RepID=UPI003B7B82D5
MNSNIHLELLKPFNRCKNIGIEQYAEWERDENISIYCHTQGANSSIRGLYYDGGTAVAAIQVTIHNGANYLSNVYVDITWRRKGIATKLYNCIVSYLRSQQNDPAIIPVSEQTNDGKIWLASLS